MSAETYVETFYGSLEGRFASIDYCDSIGGYEWDEFHVLRGADGHLYVGSDCGCSCNSFGDVDASDFKRVASWQDAAAEAQRWAKDEQWSAEARTDAAMNLIERLSQKRPAPFLEIDSRNPFGGKR